MLRLLVYLLHSVRALFRSRLELAVENLALRQQVGVLKVKRPRPSLSVMDRAFWVALRRVWPKWADVLVIVKPDTVVRWHRAGFKAFWRWKSRSLGRPGTGREIRALIRRIASENSTWGAPRVHAELQKLGFTVSERTVSRYMPKRPVKPDAVERWKVFLRNHRHGIAAMDFFTVPTVTFRILYVLFVIHHARRQLLHFNVTAHPASEWVVQQLREAFPYETAPLFLVFDRDEKFGSSVVAAVRAMSIRPLRTAYRSPWQNGVAERWIGSVRRELLDHVVVLNEHHLRRLLSRYVEYYLLDRTHLGLRKDSPLGRPTISKPSEESKVVSLPRLGGLHHRYQWREAA